MMIETGQLWRWLSANQRREAVLVLILAVFAGAGEFVTIGALVPLLAGILSQAGEAPSSGPSAYLTGLTEETGLIPLAMGIAAVAGLAAIFRWVMIWRTEKFCAQLGSDLVAAIYRNVMMESISQFEARNSSEVLSSANKVQSLIYGFVRPILVATTAAIIASSLAALLFVITPLLTVSVLAVLAVSYFCVTRLTLPHIRVLAKDISEGWSKRTAFLRESMEGKREIMLTGRFGFFERLVAEADTKLRTAEARNHILAQTPRAFFQPAMVVVLVLALVITVWVGGDVIAVLPLMAAIAFVMQRMLPTVQSIWSASVEASGNRQLVRDVLQLADPPTGQAVTPKLHQPAGLSQHLHLDAVSFGYNRNEPTLRGIDLTVNAGEWVGICGASGSGKSTLLDLIVGFRLPSDGTICVDGEPLVADRLQSWQAAIGLVREGGFLLDATLRENICFGEAPKDQCSDRLAQAAQLAGLEEIVAGRAQGLDLEVGEGGLALSNGQRQRVVLARALYRKPSVLLLDEATSAMDAELEARVLSSVAHAMPGLTVILVSHRIQSFENCGQLYEMDGQSLRRVQKSVEARRAG